MSLFPVCTLLYYFYSIYSMLCHIAGNLRENLTDQLVMTIFHKEYFGGILNHSYKWVRHSLRFMEKAFMGGSQTVKFVKFSPSEPIYLGPTYEITKFNYLCTCTYEHLQYLAVFLLMTIGLHRSI